MLVLERFTKFYPPHSHVANTELHSVFFGKMAVILTDESGRAISSVVNQSDVNLITRVPPKVKHLLVPLTDYVVYMELKNGPIANFVSETHCPDFDKMFPESSSSSLNEKQDLYMNYIRNFVAMSHEPEYFSDGIIWFYWWSSS